MIKKGNFDLVVLDLMLPETDGYEILREIGETKDIPVIVLSAKDEEMYNKLVYYDIVLISLLLNILWFASILSLNFSKHSLT